MNSTSCIALRVCVMCVLLAAVGAAEALDVAAAVPPAPVADQQLTIGSRSLRLPEGNWTYIAKGEGVITTNGGMNRRSSHFTAYAMDVKDGRMKGSVQLRMPVVSAVVTSWNDEPCKVEGTIFKDELGGNFNFPECLVVYKRRSHLSEASASDAFYGQARGWLTSQAVKSPGPVYEVVYTRYGSNDFGWVRIFVPQDAVASDEEMVAWAKQVPRQMVKLFENRENQASLPPLPSRAKP